MNQSEDEVKTAEIVRRLRSMNLSGADGETVTLARQRLFDQGVTIVTLTVAVDHLLAAAHEAGHDCAQCDAARATLRAYEYLFDAHGKYEALKTRDEDRHAHH